MMKQFEIEESVMQSILDEIAPYMDTDIREQVHFELAPCTAIEFLDRYMELDDTMYLVLNAAFMNHGIDEADYWAYWEEKHSHAHAL